MSHIYVLCPDLNGRYGGIKKLYRHVDILNQHGFSAFLLHQQDGFRCDWFEHETRIAYAANLTLYPSDYLVFPEIYGQDIASTAPGIPKVIFNQNAYSTFDSYSLDANDRETPYQSPDLKGVIVVSEDNLAYLQYTFPELNIFRIHYSIDPDIFSFSDHKKPQIAFMTTKLVKDLKQVLNILKFRGALEGFELALIEDKNEQEVATILQESLLFLWFTYQEGFGLPPAEAMACGCTVLGHTGLGGQEFLRPEFAYPLPPGDVVACAQIIESILDAYRRDPAPLRSQARAASEFIHNTYSPEREAADIVQAWQAIISQST